LLTDARRATRTDAEGRLLLLADQDRTAWDRSAIDEGLALVRLALAGRPTSRYALMAAIAAVHDAAPEWAVTDWAAIVRLYDTLHTVWPSPVVALNRAVAIGFADGAAAGLDALDALADEPQLAGYGYRAAARADLLRRLERTVEARLAYEEALALTSNLTERQFLEERLAGLPGA
jgi:RNA polymerase sigma-70 factor (ECF subfamily)